LVKRADRSLDAEISSILETAHDLCKKDGADDVANHSSSLLDIYSLKIQSAEQSNNGKALKFFFEKALPLTTGGIASAYNIGVIFRCAGNVKLRDAKYADASQYFCESFKNYDECRNIISAEETLKLWVFSSLLSGAKVSPFDDARAMSHLNKLAIKNFERIVKSVIGKNIESFLKDVRPALRDPLVAGFVPALQRVVQKDVFLDLVKPYANISIPFIATKIMATPEETENMLVEMILDGQVNGTIHQNEGVLYLKAPKTARDFYYQHMKHVSFSVSKLQNSVMLAVN